MEKSMPTTEEESIIGEPFSCDAGGPRQDERGGPSDCSGEPNDVCPESSGETVRAPRSGTITRGGLLDE